MKQLTYKVLSAKHIRFSHHLLESLALDEFERDFQNWLKLSDSSKSKKRITLRIDLTKSGNKYGKYTPELRKLYDYVNKCYINCHEIAILLVSIGKKDYILAFTLIKESHKGGHNVLCQKMINRLLRKLGLHKKDFINYCRVSLDGAFGNGTIMNYLDDKGFRYTGIKSGGKDLVIYNGEKVSLKELEKKLSKRNDFKEFNPKHKLNGEYLKVIVILEKSGLEINVVLRRFKAKKRKYRYLMILSLKRGIEAFQIAQCYEKRWHIEDCIKESKDIVDLFEYSYHSKSSRNIELFIGLRCTLYMFLNWYRVEHCRPSKTSMWKIEKSFRKEFNNIGQKYIWNMFSP